AELVHSRVLYRKLARLFGSAARGETTSLSDVDVAVAPL
ncbi:MAG TPA: nucleotidyltransferase domain-containing protein, partial [Anaerolineae bacterium]|nr:nucleotidyltransferase domain-containing protein [Anaerolineae bacterium]